MSLLFDSQDDPSMQSNSIFRFLAEEQFDDYSETAYEFCSVDKADIIPSLLSNDFIAAREQTLSSDSSCHSGCPLATCAIQPPSPASHDSMNHSGMNSPFFHDKSHECFLRDKYYGSPAVALSEISSLSPNPSLYLGKSLTPTRVHGFIQVDRGVLRKKSFDETVWEDDFSSAEDHSLEKTDDAGPIRFRKRRSQQKTTEDELTRREKNRISARECRLRKKKYVEELEKRLDDVERENLSLKTGLLEETNMKQKLVKENDALRMELHCLKSQFNEGLIHTKSCLAKILSDETKHVP